MFLLDGKLCRQCFLLRRVFRHLASHHRPKQSFGPTSLKICVVGMSYEALLLRRSMLSQPILPTDNWALFLDFQMDRESLF